MSRPPILPQWPGIRRAEPDETPLSWEEQRIAVRNGYTQPARPTLSARILAHAAPQQPEESNE